MYEIEKELAAEGAAFLDKKVPGWHRLINTRRLDMGAGFAEGKSCGCVCAQLDLAYMEARGSVSGDWFRAFSRISRFRKANRWAKAAELGFVIGGEASYTGLTHAWRLEIRRRNTADRLAA